MKTKSLVITLFLSLMVLFAGEASAQVDYNEGFQILPSNYLAPKMDCVNQPFDSSSVGQECVLLAYDNTTKKLQLFYTTSRFLEDSYPLTPNLTVTTDANYEYIIAINPSTSIPYDIEYSGQASAWMIYDSTNVAKKYVNGAITSLQTTTSDLTYLLSGDRPSNYLWTWFNKENGNFEDRVYKHDFSSYDSWGTSKSQNWITTPDYVSGLHLESEDGDLNKSYIFYPYNSTTGEIGYSNNTDSYISGNRYDGIYEKEIRVSSYRYFMRNSTDVIRYDYDTNHSYSFFEMGSNNIISQATWASQTDSNDILVVFQNSSGINIYSIWSSLYTPVPDEYNESKNVAAVREYNGILFGYVNDPYYPRISCTPDVGSCAILYYDAGVLSTNGAGLKLYYSTTPDQPDWTYIYKFPESYTIRADYAPPYDICYHELSGKFRIISGSRRKLYTWDGVGTPVNVYTYSGGASYNQRYPLMFVDDDCEYLAVGVSLAFAHWNHIEIYPWATTTVVDDFEYNGITLSSIEGYITAEDDLSAYWYDVIGTSYEYDNLDLYDDAEYTKSIQYFYPEESIAFFERRADHTPSNYGKGIYYAGNFYPNGVDWIYPTVSPYYIYDILAGEETESMSTYFEESKIYAVAKRRNDYGCILFLNCGKVFFYEKATNPLFVTTSYYDDLIETTNPLNTSMIVECTDPSINYTDAAGASFNVFQLPCSSNINLTLQTTAAYPFNAEVSFDFLAGCNQMNINAIYVKSFTSTITVRDQITGQAVPSATVYVDGIPHVTDSDGQVDFVVAPTNANFTLTPNPSSCLITLDATGASVSESHYVYATKTGYYPYSATLSFTSAGQTIYINRGEYIVSRVYYKDGVEATGEKTSAVINATGADETYVLLDGVPYNMSQSNEFPVTFQTLDASSSYTVTLGLTWGNYTDTNDVSITSSQNNYGCNENACFTLPFYSNSIDVQCSTDLDCEESFCIGNLFKELLSCNTETGQCVYEQTLCPTFCDNDIGCYTQAILNDSCNFDTECYDLIECISTAVLRDAICSPSLGVCVTNHVQCTYGCEDGACNPAPTVPVCDQSTVEGMLACTQSGIMGFIGSVYDPMFLMVIVIAIVIIAITLFSLTIKGISNVIR